LHDWLFQPALPLRTLRSSLCALCVPFPFGTKEVSQRAQRRARKVREEKKAERRTGLGATASLVSCKPVLQATAITLQPGK